RCRKQSQKGLMHMKMSRVTEFGQLRERTGFTVKQLAQLFGKSERTIYRWERGETRADPKIMAQLRAISGLGSTSSISPLFRFIDLFAGIGGMRRAFES